MATKQELEQAYSVILDHLRANSATEAERQNFEGSEERCARALLDTCKSVTAIRESLTHILAKAFPVEGADTSNNVNAQHPYGIVCQGPIRINSCCPHHLYPVIYEAYVAYIPKAGRVLGLSKLARLCKELGHRPVLHEQLAADIADVLCAPQEQLSEQYEIDYGVDRRLLPTKFPCIESEGSAVLLVGKHTCMMCRGVEEDTSTSVCELRGNFNNDGMEQKFYSLVKSIRVARI